MDEKEKNRRFKLAMEMPQIRHPIFSFEIHDKKSGKIINEIKIFLDGEIEGMPLNPGQKIGGKFNRIGGFACWCLPLCRHFLEKDSIWCLENSSSQRKDFILCDGFPQAEQPCSIKKS